MNGCCQRLRPDDGVMDKVAVERAMQGLNTELTRDERKLVIWRLHQTRGWGLDRISQHLGYSRSKVSELLADAHRRVGR